MLGTQRALFQSPPRASSPLEVSASTGSTSGSGSCPAETAALFACPAAISSQKSCPAAFSVKNVCPAEVSAQKSCPAAVLVPSTAHAAAHAGVSALGNSVTSSAATTPRYDLGVEGYSPSRYASTEGYASSPVVPRPGSSSQSSVRSAGAPLAAANVQEDGEAHMMMTPRSPQGRGAATVGVTNTPSREEIIAYGGIPEPAVLRLRSSARIQAQLNADATAMERAMDMADSRDHDSGTVYTPKLSFCHIPDSIIVSRASRLGVSLGKSPTEIASSVKNLKDVEKDRSLFMKKNLNNDDNDPHNLFVSKVSGLCEDLTEEDNVGMDDHTDLSCRDLVVKRGRKTVTIDKRKLRRSARIKQNQR